MVADIEELETMDASEIYSKRLNAKEVIFPKEKRKFIFPIAAFLIPLKYVDVSRTTRTNLDVEQERRIDDDWNMDGSRDLSGSWTGFTQFALLEEKAPD